MEIEGTYTFAAPLERVLAVLSEPESLGRAIPGCERIMQLGPAGANGAMSLELRLRVGPGPAVYATTAEVTPRREPPEMQVKVHGRGPSGSVTAHGTLRLTAEGNTTRGDYRWEIEPDGLRGDERRALSDGAGQQLAEQLCERLGAELRDGNRRQQGAILKAETPRGRIMTVPDGAVEQGEEGNSTTAARQALWMSAGLVVGLGALALTISLTRRFRPRTRERGDV